MAFNQLKVHPFQSYGFRWVHPHPYTGDVILDVQALTGSIGMTGMTYFLPSVLAHCLLVTPGGGAGAALSWPEKVLSTANFVIGMALMLAGVYTTIGDLAEDSTVGMCNRGLL